MRGFLYLVGYECYLCGGLYGTDGVAVLANMMYTDPLIYTAVLF
jgi:hypothetical protein